MPITINIIKLLVNLIYDITRGDWGRLSQFLIRKK